MNDPHYYAIIMAGGGGTRLWPLSRQSRPKQLVKLLGKETLFRTAVHRLSGYFSYDKIYIVTIADQARELQEDCPEIPVENFIIEPQPRGTASVIGLGAVALRKHDPQATMAVLTSDHYIKNNDVFYHLLDAAYQAASQNYLITLGIKPTFPSTGYGYIQHGGLIGKFENMKVYKVMNFKEKPDEEQARSFLEKGDHDWNSGMFVWKCSSILDEINRQMPELSAGLERISNDWATPNRAKTLEMVWSALRAQTIDYGIMENARQVAVIPANDLGWSDVGSWNSLFEVLSSDKEGNLVMAEQFLPFDTKNTLVFSKDSKKLIATIGVDDLVIVDTDDALLVCRRDEVQKVRQIVNSLQQSNRKEYL